MILKELGARREPLLPSHPHGYLVARPDRKLGVIRISKSASTESTQRLGGQDWLHFDQFEGPIIAFVRDPYQRFVSAIPETMLRMTHWLVEECDRKDRLIIPEDIHYELCNVAERPVEEVAKTFLELVEYAHFEAHHEPQFHYLANRHLQLRVNPRLYLTDAFENGIAQIEEWVGIKAKRRNNRGNVGGAKPLKGRTRTIDIYRRVTRTGVHRVVKHAGFLGLRYRRDSGAISLRELNSFANRFSNELKSARLGEEFKARVNKRYAEDVVFYKIVKAKGGNVHAAAIWQEFLERIA